MADKNKYNAEEMLENIFYYMTEIESTKDFNKTVALLTDFGSMLLGADRASFWFRDKNSKQYWTLAAKGNAKISIEQGRGIVGRVIENDENYICDNPYEDENFDNKVDETTGYTTRSILCVPVQNSDGAVIGAFEAINKLDENGNDVAFDEKDVKRLSIVTAFCGKTLESKLLYQEAMIDRLTGLNNRFAFYEYYSTKIDTADQKEISSMIMCDIDHFKNVNDTYGHNAGDIVLKEIADIFCEAAGYEDAVVRWGGEEFIIIKKGKNLKETADFAEQLRCRVQSHIFKYDGGKINVTMSFGVTDIDLKISIEENIGNADKNLYNAKNSGRNKVVSEPQK